MPSERPGEVDSIPPAEGSDVTTVLTTTHQAPATGRSGRFVEGLQHYWNGSFTDAAAEFKAAREAAPQNAKYAYFHALALHGAGLVDEAQEVLVTAVELERRAPIASWGRVMQRVQGASRLWLEEARKQLLREAKLPLQRPLS
jgi:Flp pilus assembly protein TadD